MTLKKIDLEIYNIIEQEKKRQQEHIELIASENFVSSAVLEAQGSVLTNKYAEGYPQKRYYGGCEFVDLAETVAKNRLMEIYNAQFVNVQPHSGSQANMAVYRALLQHGDVVLGMGLESGGHLTHGHKANFSGVDYQIYGYGLDFDKEIIDYDNVEKMALEIKPKMIIAGASAYPRQIDFKRFRAIADLVGAYLFVDMAHIAGLVAAKLHQNPLEYAHVVTSTTHKTLRGPRGGIILTNDEQIAKKIDKVVFPGIQGGPLMHVIAAKAVAFKEALTSEFVEYQKQVIKNAQTLAQTLKDKGYHIISGGTDNHLILVDIKKSIKMTGKKAEQVLGLVNITCNKNAIPNDSEKATVTSGIRLGTPAMTTRGFKEKEMILVADFIDQALRNADDEELLTVIKKQVIELTNRFPLEY